MPEEKTVKILFIVPPHVTFRQFINPAYNERIVSKNNGNFGAVLTDMPLGVLSLSAYLKKRNPAGIDVRLADFNILLNKARNFEYGGFYDFFMAELAKFRDMRWVPDIAGISALFTSTYANMLDLAKCIQELFPQALITGGGGVPTNLYKEIFRDSRCFDALCFGEGERPFAGLVFAADRKKYLEKSPSWITAPKLSSGKAFNHDFIQNLDDIPFYDYGICNADDYGINPALTAYASIEEKRQNFHVMTSRGCPHRCCFCSSHTIHGRAMRYYSVTRVREDFRRLRDEYGARTIVFQDDHFVADRKRVHEIIGIVRDLGLRAVFQNSLALYALDRDMLEDLKTAGVDQLVLSVESGSQRVLREIMHKPLNLSIVKRVANDCRKLGIYTDVNILIGLPGETKKDISDTRSFLKTINANWFHIFCATPLVGSEMLDICVKKKYLKTDSLEYDYKKAVVETEDFSAEYIQEMAYVMNLELNFAANSDFRFGDFQTALKGFENAIRAKNNHVLAYYYAAKCCERLGDNEKAERYMALARKNSVDPFWQKHIKMFDIAELRA